MFKLKLYIITLPTTPKQVLLLPDPGVLTLNLTPLLSIDVNDQPHFYRPESPTLKCSVVHLGLNITNHSLLNHWAFF